jgi:hypothetical protein
MVKWFAYIVVLLIFAPDLSSATIKAVHLKSGSAQVRVSLTYNENLADTTKNKKQEQEDKKKIKEVAKAKRQPKPEKIEPGDNTETSKPKTNKPKRQRRPEGLVRPPEIPRRNGN